MVIFISRKGNVYIKLNIIKRNFIVFKIIPYRLNQSLVEMISLCSAYVAVVRHLSHQTKQVLYYTWDLGNLDCTDEVKAEFVAMWKIVKEFPDKFETFDGTIPNHSFINQNSRCETFAKWKRDVNDAHIAFMITGKNAFGCLVDESKSLDETKEWISNFKSKHYGTKNEIVNFFDNCITDIIDAANDAAKYNVFVTPERVQMLRIAFFNNDVIVTIATQVAKLAELAHTKAKNHKNVATEANNRKHSIIYGAQNALERGKQHEDAIAELEQLCNVLKLALAKPDALPDVSLKYQNAKANLEIEKNKTGIKSAKLAQVRINEATDKSNSANELAEKTKHIACLYDIDNTAIKLAVDDMMLCRAAATICQIEPNSNNLATRVSVEIDRLGLVPPNRLKSNGRTLSILAATSVALANIETTTTITITVKRSATEADLDEQGDISAKK